MPRLPRYFVPDVPLHVIARGNNRERVFACSRDFGTYRRYLTEAASAHGLAVHAYVLMTNHIHLLATPSTATSSAKTLQSVGIRYARYVGSAYGRSGTAWEGRYRATLVDTEAYLLTCMRYIELNPVRAGMVDVPGAYPWSSYAANAAGRPDELITPHALYSDLGSTCARRQAAYRVLFGEPIAAADIDTIHDATNNAWALGAASFVARIGATSARRAERLPLGRPRKK